MEWPIASLVVHLRRDAESCIASFSGSLTETTRATIDAIAELIGGEQRVLLDFSRVDEVDRGGADAVEVLVHSVRAHGAHLRIAYPTRRMSEASLGE